MPKRKWRDVNDNYVKKRRLISFNVEIFKFDKLYLGLTKTFKSFKHSESKILVDLIFLINIGSTQNRWM